MHETARAIATASAVNKRGEFIKRAQLNRSQARRQERFAGNLFYKWQGFIFAQPSSKAALSARRHTGVSTAAPKTFT